MFSKNHSTVIRSELVEMGERTTANVLGLFREVIGSQVMRCTDANSGHIAVLYLPACLQRAQIGGVERVSCENKDTRSR